jgi:hypothetical protein
MPKNDGGTNVPNVLVSRLMASVPVGGGGEGGGEGGGGGDGNGGRKLGSGGAGGGACIKSADPAAMSSTCWKDTGLAPTSCVGTAAKAGAAISATNVCKL